MKYNKTHKVLKNTRASLKLSKITRKIFIPLAILTSLILLQSVKSIMSPSKRVVTEHNSEIGFTQSILLSEENIYEHQSEYQKIRIHKSKHYGKILVLDDVVQLTEKDADSYNEMLTHLAMMEHPCPKRVLIIGGGDGYVTREVLKHDCVEHVDHVELDPDVIAACKLHFPSTKAAWDDPRVKVHVCDGMAFVKDAPSHTYDVIIQDSSDPFAVDEEDAEKHVDLPSSVLYTSDHFAHMHRILKADGIMNFQSETIHIPSDIKGVKSWRDQALNVGFESADYATIFITTYITGQIGCLLCRKNKLDRPLEEVRKRWEGMEKNGLGTSYYHPGLQRSSFQLPLWAHRAIYGSY